MTNNQASQSSRRNKVIVAIWVGVYLATIWLMVHGDEAANLYANWRGVHYQTPQTISSLSFQASLLGLALFCVVTVALAVVYVPGKIRQRRAEHEARIARMERFLQTDFWGGTE